MNENKEKQINTENEIKIMKNKQLSRSIKRYRADFMHRQMKKKSF